MPRLGRIRSAANSCARGRYRGGFNAGCRHDRADALSEHPHGSVAKRYRLFHGGREAEGLDLRKGAQLIADKARQAASAEPPWRLSGTIDSGSMPVRENSKCSAGEFRGRGAHGRARIAAR